MTELIHTAIQGDERQILKRGSIVHVPRQDIEIAWIETYFMDPTEKRAAFSRLAIARGWNIQALITMDFWADDAARVLSVWDEVMRSVELGKYVQDPTKGDVLH